MKRLEEQLRQKLTGPLPGSCGQLLLSPRPRIGWKPDHYPDDARAGAALLLIYPVGEEPHVLLTVRAGSLANHAGQVSLPGGSVESGESLADAALREAQEEVNVDPGAVRLLGPLTPLHIPVSGFILNTFVGMTDRRPEFSPDPGEVARILEPSIAELAGFSGLTVERRLRGETEYQVPVVQIEGERLWGATAMILAEFLCVLGYRPDPFADRP